MWEECAGAGPRAGWVQVVRLRQPESSRITDIFLYLGHARAHDKVQGGAAEPLCGKAKSKGKNEAKFASLIIADFSF